MHWKKYLTQSRVFGDATQLDRAGVARGWTSGMNPIFLEIAGGIFPNGDWIWGVVGVLSGVFIEILMNGSPARARASKKHNRR